MCKRVELKTFITIQVSEKLYGRTFENDPVGKHESSIKRIWHKTPILAHSNSSGNAFLELHCNTGIAYENTS